jgi:hypothetical protein
VRRLAARLTGQPAAVTDSVLRPGEVLVFDGASPSFRAMSTGHPVRSDHLGRKTVDRLTRRPGGHQIAAGYTTFLAVPLAARGLVLGCATFARAPGDPGFGADDIALAAELAARAAVCIDNARLYDRERRTAFALQHGLLPREPRIPAGMEVAHRYLPVGASVVGGDWHDIVPLSGGRAALIVGDAVGHGPEAAAVMVQLRTAAHTLARLDLPAEDMLHRLDRMAAGMPAAPFATCIYAVIDPERNSCVIAKAGHPPPLPARPRRCSTSRQDSRSASAPGLSRRRRSACRRGPRWPCTPTAWWKAASGRWTRASLRWVRPWARRWPRPAARSIPAARWSLRRCASAATMTSRWCSPGSGRGNLVPASTAQSRAAPTRSRISCTAH